MAMFREDIHKSIQLRSFQKCRGQQLTHWSIPEILIHQLKQELRSAETIKVHEGTCTSNKNRTSESLEHLTEISGTTTAPPPTNGVHPTHTNPHRLGLGVAKLHNLPGHLDIWKPTFQVPPLGRPKVERNFCNKKWHKSQVSQALVHLPETAGQELVFEIYDSDSTKNVQCPHHQVMPSKG